MENVFDGCQSYGEKWQVTASRNFNDAEKAAVRTAVVTESTVTDSRTGESVPKKSVMFSMVSGAVKYIGLSEHSGLSVGDIVNLNAVKLLTLKRGSEQIVRVE